MRCNCPHGWKRVTKLKSLTLEDSTVEIHDNICDSADLCGKSHCEYHDTTREGTRRFQKALAYSPYTRGPTRRAEQEATQLNHQGGGWTSTKQTVHDSNSIEFLTTSAKTAS